MLNQSQLKSVSWCSKGTSCVSVCVCYILFCHCAPLKRTCICPIVTRSSWDVVNFFLSSLSGTMLWLWLNSACTVPRLSLTTQHCPYPTLPQTSRLSKNLRGNTAETGNCGISMWYINCWLFVKADPYILVLHLYIFALEKLLEWCY